MLASHAQESKPDRGIEHFLLIGTIVLVVVSVGSLFVGVSGMTPGGVLRGDGMERTILFESRIPRLAAILLSGSSMAVAGLIMQAMTRNRFVAPSTAGTVQSAQLGIVIASIWFGNQSLGTIMAISVLCSLLGTAVLLVMIRRVELGDSLIVPLLGLMYGGVIDALTTHLAFKNDLLQSLNAWTNGNFAAVLKGRYELLYIVGALAVLSYLFADRFTLAGMGRDVSVNLGVAYERVVMTGLAIVSVVAAITVVVVGAIPFLGLIVPNVATAIAGDNLRRVVPVTALGGALLVLICDLVSRTIRYPYEIPVSSVVGLVGGVVFIAMLLSDRTNRAA